MGHDDAFLVKAGLYPGTDIPFHAPVLPHRARNGDLQDEKHDRNDQGKNDADQFVIFVSAVHEGVGCRAGIIQGMEQNGNDQRQDVFVFARFVSGSAFFKRSMIFLGACEVPSFFFLFAGSRTEGMRIHQFFIIP